LTQLTALGNRTRNKGWRKEKGHTARRKDGLTDRVCARRERERESERERGREGERERGRERASESEREGGREGEIQTV